MTAKVSDEGHKHGKGAILAIDAATEACSVALEYNGVLYHRFEICPAAHSQRLLPLVDEVLKQAQVKLSQLDAIAYSTGPGSFTGVRIGVSAAQGLAFGADLPMIGVSTLQTMAQGAIRLHQAQAVGAAIDARMGEVYTNEYTNENGMAIPIGADSVIKPEQVSYQSKNQAHTVGTGWQSYEQPLNAALTNGVATDVLYPDAQDMLVFAQQTFAQGDMVPPEQAQPLYVRDTVTWKKLPGR